MKKLILILSLAASPLIAQQYWLLTTNDLHDAIRIDPYDTKPGQTVYWHNISGQSVSNLIDGTNVIQTVNVGSVYYTYKTTNAIQ